jgi:hypothetical protein
VSRTALRPTQPPIQCVRGALSLGVKRPGRDADHSSPSSAEVKNAWSYTSTPQYVFIAWCLVKHRDNFTLPYKTYIMTVKGQCYLTYEKAEFLLQCNARWSCVCNIGNIASSMLVPFLATSPFALIGIYSDSY